MYHRVRYDRRSSGQILRGGISPPLSSFFSPTPRFQCSASRESSRGGRGREREPRSSFQSGPNIGRPVKWPPFRSQEGRGEIRQIALSGLATSKWIKLRSAIDSSHAPFDRSTRAISLFRACLTAEPCPRLFLSVLYVMDRRVLIRLFIELNVAVYIVK